MKKLITILLILAMLPTMAFAASTTVTSFRDVPSTHWAYSNVMAMTANGLFSGTTDPVNGVGTFAPDTTMTCAEFITVIDRALYKDTALSTTDPWWKSAYDLAISKGIIKAGELDMTKAMTRQEMAMVMVRASGETPSQMVSTSHIADYNSIGTAYTDYVLKAYSLGMLTGVDSNGTFAPTATMSRAQGATVLNRLTNKSARVAVDFSVPTANTQIKAATIVPDGTGYDENNKSNVKYYLINTEGYKYLRVTMKGLNCPCDVSLYDASNNYITYVSPQVDVPEMLLTISGYTTVRIAIGVYVGKTGELASMTLENPAPIPSYSIPTGATALTAANTTFNEYDTTYANGQFIRHNAGTSGHTPSDIKFKNAGCTTITFTVTTQETAMHVVVYEPIGVTGSNAKISTVQAANTTKTYTADISDLKDVHLSTYYNHDCDSVITNVCVK